MTIVNGKNSDEVILSEGREANEPEDLRLFFGTSQLPGKGLPIRAPLAAGVGNHGLIKLLFVAFSSARVLGPLVKSQPNNSSPPPTTSPNASTATTISCTPLRPNSPRATRVSAAPASRAAHSCFLSPAACVGIIRTLPAKSSSSTANCLVLLQGRPAGAAHRRQGT